MSRFECKICGNRCFKNRNFTRFLALGETNCSVATCERCHTGFLCGDPPDNLYDDAYFTVSTDQYDYEKQSVANEEHYGEILEKLIQHSVGSERLVDVGCGMGHFVRQASRYFDEAIGIDGHVDFSHFVGCFEQLRIENIEGLRIGNSEFDAITLNHSLEHVEDPVTLLENSFSALRPGGVLYVEVPFQYGSLYDKISTILNPKRSPDFLSFHHKTFFYPKSLEFAIEKCGFQVLELKTFLPKRGAGRFDGLRGKLLYAFLLFSSFIKRADYIAIFAQRPR